MFLLGLLGNPVEQSLSPQIHQHFAEQFGITLEYQKILVPLNEFKNFANAFVEKGCLGFNVTAPFKTDAFQWVQEYSPRAAQARAVNTVLHKNGIIYGDNTDGIGFIKDLEHKNITIKNQTIVFAGAGGAAQGILPALLEQSPARVVIVNRNPEKLMALRMRYPQIETARWQDLPALLPTTSLLIDATSQADVLQTALNEHRPPQTIKIYETV